MDKELEKKMKSFICLLQTINDSQLPFNPDNILTEDISELNKKFYNDCRYYSSICRMHCIQLNGNVKDACQELFNEKGFAIEREVKGKTPFFIRTEKGLIKF